MRVFIDTSAFLAVLDADDDNHRRARDYWQRILQERTVLVTTNYVLLETHALVQNRLGMEAVRVFAVDIVPTLHVVWVDEKQHRLGVSALLAAARRRLSLVDCVSFEVARDLHIGRVFCFDKHFVEQGFICEPR
ncbi:MAG: type II toxin-antitoxin system VapC family toxin [Chloroflexi bacterium]|nr:type II toxin-antitoxin system VapC family toxin [Chloroflexota bacterium]